ncbi:MAG: DUF2752 domain-containing protein, partial [Flavobacteriales bacterium]
LSSILVAFFDIDICLPCIWKSIFDVQCPGCGLTTAFVSLLKLDFYKAYESNVLIFVLLPAGIYYSIKDLLQFARKSEHLISKK